MPLDIVLEDTDTGEHVGSLTVQLSPQSGHVETMMDILAALTNSATPPDNPNMPPAFRIERYGGNGSPATPSEFYRYSDNYAATLLEMILNTVDIGPVSSPDREIIDNRLINSANRTVDSTSLNVTSNLNHPNVSSKYVVEKDINVIDPTSTSPSYSPLIIQISEDVGEELNPTYLTLSSPLARALRAGTVLLPSTTPAPSTTTTTTTTSAPATTTTTTTTTTSAP